ncbi:MAG: hypothetical protein INQ03_25480 [Candidatus Heimdallarchaeota archaeon]|nr:hypothetical protein [Candidatus Heimdallarchaeota archaeon]
MLTRQCLRCLASNPIEAKFCVNCGNSLEGIKGRFTGLQKRLMHQSRTWLDKTKLTLDQQLSEYISRLERNEDIRLGNLQVPDNRKETILNAMKSFKDRISPTGEVSEEFQQWLDNLPEMLDEQNCIICFAKWKPDEEIVVCKHCHSGGHKNHLINWINQNKTCPLCRQSITVNHLIPVSF